jgi:Flp pilus assembly CpaF family ATPase
MQADVSMLVCGNTSSGKTSTLNALFSFVPLNERIVITEETPEMRLPHQHVVRLAASSEAGIGLKHLIADTLRMRPDRVIVGEARTAEEACALFDTLQSGQARGAYGTFHAQGADEALQRLRTLGVCNADLRSLDVLAVQRRMMRYDAGARSSTEVRRATEICEVHDGTAHALFSYDPAGDALAGCAENSRIARRLCEGFGMSEREFEAELRGRAGFLKHVAATNAGADAVLDAVQRYAYDAKYKDSFAKRLGK